MQVQASSAELVVGALPGGAFRVQMSRAGGRGVLGNKYLHM